MSRNGGGTSYGYRVEARSKDARSPHQIGGQFIGPLWTPVPLEKASLGVPNGTYCREMQAVTELQSYAAASALMAWAAALVPLSVGIELRLVRVKFTYQWAETDELEGAPVSYFEQERTWRDSAQPIVVKETP